jgi:hypothetical protein
MRTLITSGGTSLLQLGWGQAMQCTVPSAMCVVIMVRRQPSHQ